MKIPDKNLGSLNHTEIALAHAAVRALMQAHIPAALFVPMSGVIYKGEDNVIERTMAITWLTPKGMQVLTLCRTSESFISQKKVRLLVEGVSQAYRQHMEIGL